MVFIQPGEQLSVDLVVMDTRTVHQEKYVLVLVDQGTTYTFSFLLRHKSQSVDKITALLKYIQTQTGITVKTVKTDGGGEFDSADLMQQLSDKGVELVITPPFTHLSIMERMRGLIRL